MKQFVIVIIIGVSFFLATNSFAEGIQIISKPGAYSDPQKKSPPSQMDHDTSKKELIKQLEEAVKPIPASNRKANLAIYKQLLALDPDNPKYQRKVAYYSKPLAKQQTKPAPKVKKMTSAQRERERKLANAADIHLLSWRWSRSSTYYVTAEGQIKNTSGRRLSGVVALVTWYDENERMVTSDKSSIEYDPIMPGQLSPFRVIERYNPAMKSATVEFKYIFGGKIKTYVKK